MKKKIIIVCTLIAVLALFGFGVYRFKHKSGGYQAQEGNKSLIRNSEYEEDNEQLTSRIFHLSFDDVSLLFQDITENEDTYNSIFENETLKYFKELHNKYGVVISCYVYYADGEFNLSKCTDKFAKEFADNYKWLRFGFHTVDESTNYEDGAPKQIVSDYNKTVNELIRITGSKDCIDNVIRLQNFAGNKNCIQAIHDQPNGVDGLLTADDLRTSYYLDKTDNEYIYAHDYLKDNDIYFYSTDLRMEFVDSVDNKIDEFTSPTWNNQLNALVVFTHEWLLDNKIKNSIDKLCRYAYENGYSFVFPEDNVAY